MPAPHGANFLLQRAKSAVPSFRMKTPRPESEVKAQRQPTIVMYADENRPLNSRQGSMETIYPIHSNAGSQQDLTSASIQPFHNNPSLPLTQRDLVGNNLRFQSSSFRYDPRHGGEQDQLAPYLLYRDSLRQSMTTPPRANSGLPRMHYGRQGGAWRHIKQTNTHSNANFLFIDGTVRVDDSIKYPIYQFGYPPMDQPQHVYMAAPEPDLTNSYDQSFEPMTWSATNELNRRPSLSRYANRYERHAKEGFNYWPQDSAYQKPKAKTTATGTYKTWLGLSDAILKV